MAVCCRVNQVMCGSVLQSQPSHPLCLALPCHRCTLPYPALPHVSAKGSHTPLIHHIAMREFVRADLTGGSPSTSVTVYTKHVHVMFNHQTMSPQMSFLKELCSRSANCSRTLSKTGLSVTNSLVYGAVARRSTHELSHD